MPWNFLLMLFLVTSDVFEAFGSCAPGRDTLRVFNLILIVSVSLLLTINIAAVSRSIGCQEQWTQSHGRWAKSGEGASWYHVCHVIIIVPGTRPFRRHWKNLPPFVPIINLSFSFFSLFSFPFFLSPNNAKQPTFSSKSVSYEGEHISLVYVENPMKYGNRLWEWRSKSFFFVKVSILGAVPDGGEIPFGFFFWWLGLQWLILHTCFTLLLNLVYFSFLSWLTTQWQHSLFTCAGSFCVSTSLPLCYYSINSFTSLTCSILPYSTTHLCLLVLPATMSPPGRLQTGTSTIMGYYS